MNLHRDAFFIEYFCCSITVNINMKPSSNIDLYSYMASSSSSEYFAFKLNFLKLSCLSKETKHTELLSKVRLRNRN